MTTAHQSPAAHPEPHEEPVPEYRMATAPLVYTVVALGLTVSIFSLLLSRGDVGFGTAALALLVAAPFLLYARLALARPGVESVLGGVLLLVISIWGSIRAVGDESAPFARLSLELVVLELAIFLAGMLLRAAVPPRPDDVADEDRTGVPG